jgi:hypothetical protein
MMPPANCPQCAAPLPPAAPRCGFCGFVTPWGATLSAHQAQASALAAQRDKQQRIAKAQSTAKTGMILALVGLPICCGPLSLVGGVLGWRGASAAKAEGAPRPVTSVIAMIVAALSMAAFVTGTVMYLRDQRMKEERLTEVRGRLAGKRELPTIEAKPACDLVEEYLTENGYGESMTLDKINCDGALAVTDRRASLADVRFNFGTKHSTVNACLERRSRWFVLKLVEGSSCADLPPPAPFTTPPRQFSEEEARADEKKARDDLAAAAGAVTIKAFTDKLQKVKTHAAGPGAEKACTKSDLARYVTGPDRRKVLAVDYDLLNGTRTASGLAVAWTFMSDSSFMKILDADPDVEGKVKAIDALRGESGAAIVVYRADKKLWPVVKDDSGYDGGEFEGWLFVYDVDTGDRVCGTRLAFESSDEVSFKKSRFSADKAKFEEAIAADFRENFQQAATEAIKRAAPDLRLGYKASE